MAKIAETTLSPGNLTTVPSGIREALQLKPGDKITWHLESYATYRTSAPPGEKMQTEQVVVIRKVAKDGN